MSKVYCSECENYIPEKFDTMDKEKCGASGNREEMTYIPFNESHRFPPKKYLGYIAKPKDLNHNNLCPWFIKKKPFIEIIKEFFK